jgi:hypothetical protein
MYNQYISDERSVAAAYRLGRAKGPRPVDGKTLSGQTG